MISRACTAERQADPLGRVQGGPNLAVYARELGGLGVGMGQRGRHEEARQVNRLPLPRRTLDAGCRVLRRSDDQAGRGVSGKGNPERKALGETFLAQLVIEPHHRLGGACQLGLDIGRIDKQDAAGERRLRRGAAGAAKRSGPAAPRGLSPVPRRPSRRRSGPRPTWDGGRYWTVLARQPPGCPAPSVQTSWLVLPPMRATRYRGVVDHNM